MHYDYVLGRKVSDAKPMPVKLKRKRHVSNSIPLPDNWPELRLIVIDRDVVCVDCGGNGQGVHHNDLDRLNNDCLNLVYLCWPCHMLRHHKH